MSDSYTADFLTPATADQAYPLVSLLRPGLSPSDWRAIIRRRTRDARHRAGLMMVRNPRAIFEG